MSRLHRGTRLDKRTYSAMRSGGRQCSDSSHSASINDITVGGLHRSDAYAPKYLDARRQP